MRSVGPAESNTTWRGAQRVRTRGPRCWWRWCWCWCWWCTAAAAALPFYQHEHQPASHPSRPRLRTSSEASSAVPLVRATAALHRFAVGRHRRGAVAVQKAQDERPQLRVTLCEAGARGVMHNSAACPPHCRAAVCALQRCPVGTPSATSPPGGPQPCPFPRPTRCPNTSPPSPAPRLWQREQLRVGRVVQRRVQPVRQVHQPHVTLQHRRDVAELRHQVEQALS